MHLTNLLPLVSLVSAGIYSQLPSVSNNPSNVTAYIYVPDKLQTDPPVLVVPHWCHGSAEAAYTGSPFASAADTYGFLVVYPDSSNIADKCWDVASNYTLTHEGGGDSQGIVAFTKYVLQKYNGNSKRVFVQGTSSGAMMTNVLLATYPDVFAAGSAWAGVATGCFAGPTRDYWNDDCATGKVIKTGAEWKQIVLNAYPGYNGYRPKLQVFHGSIDTVLLPQNLQEEIKEWTSVYGISATPTKTNNDTPLIGWTQSVYGDGSKFTATLATGVDHNIQTQLDTVISWFDLACTSNCFQYPDNGGSSSTITTSRSTTTSRPNTTTAPTTTSTPGSGGTIPQWSQCGGISWTGSGSCAWSYKCVKLNDYYSQCQ